MEETVNLLITVLKLPSEFHIAVQMFRDVNTPNEKARHKILIFCIDLLIGQIKPNHMDSITACRPIAYFFHVPLSGTSRTEPGSLWQGICPQPHALRG